GGHEGVAPLADRADEIVELRPVMAAAVPRRRAGDLHLHRPAPGVAVEAQGPRVRRGRLERAALADHADAAAQAVRPAELQARGNGAAADVQLAGQPGVALEAAERIVFAGDAGELAEQPERAVQQVHAG